MEDKMLILLKQLSIYEEVDKLKDSTLRKVTVNQSNSYGFYIHTLQLLPLKEVQTLLEAKDKFPYPCEFIFDKVSIYNEKEIIEYIEYIFNNKYTTLLF